MKDSKMWVWVILIIGLLVVIFAQRTDSIQKQSLSVNYFDESGNKIGENSYSIVNGKPNVAFISFDLEVQNLDIVPLTIYISALTPESANLKKGINKQEFSAREVKTLSTELIETKTYEGSIQEFCIYVTSDPRSKGTSENRKGITKEICISLDIQKDYVSIDENPIGNKSTGINPTCSELWSCSSWNSCNAGAQSRTCTDTNSCGTTSDKPPLTQTCSVNTCSENWQCSSWGTCTNNLQSRTCTDTNSCGTTAHKPALTQTCVSNPTCTESWTCSTWGVCSNGIQARTCVDANNCGTTENKPITENVCATPPPPKNSPTFSTNAVGGNYRVSGTWIKIGYPTGLITYDYNGYSSYKCLPENAILITPEGFVVCSRPSYSTGTRVYLDDGRGNIYKAV